MPQTVMVVDDDPDILELSRLVLEGGGFRVVEAPSGAEALRMLDDERPDLILLDINMPGMDGWQVLRVLKVDERTSTIPVALFSIKSQVRDRVQGLQGGACDYIAKPFACEELLGRVRHILDSVRDGEVNA
ncbi:MAG TPA: response regulator [Candidatus Cryosericum sp.]|nr:response regulator [Candidatus Cryosericum sp.]